METNQGFILTAHSEDQAGQLLLRYFGVSDHGPFELVFDRERPVFFVAQDSTLPTLPFTCERKKVSLKNFSGANVDALYFQNMAQWYEAKDTLAQKGVRTFEVDIRPEERFLMERFINGEIEFKGEFQEDGGLRRFLNPQVKKGSHQPCFKVFSFDIETSLKNDLFSIAYHCSGKKEEIKKVLMVGDPSQSRTGLEFMTNEKELLLRFMQEFHQIDPDIIIGWHVIGFDLSFLERKCAEYGLALNLGRKKSTIRITEKKGSGYFTSVAGRVVLDGPQTLRSNFFSFENFKLETVAQELLGVGKDIEESGGDKVEEIERRFHEDKEALAKYNLLDCTLVTDIFEKTKLVELMLTRTQISGMLLDRIGLSTAAFDHFFLPPLHRKGYVASNVTDIKRDFSSVGGHVLDPISGLHEHVIVLDFKSLYPSIIRTFKIDPYSRLMSDIDTLKTPGGYKFSKTHHILPDFIEKLLDKRAQAKREENAPLSQAIKILMNSFYGVMGSGGSRFYHADLPSAITTTGHWILQSAIGYLETHHYEVVYGDTDSVFVKLKNSDATKVSQKGNQIAKEINEYLDQKIKREYDLESFLDIEFEKYYRKFFLPASRSGLGGAKKRYAGLLKTDNGEKLHFAGMEFVRSDWTKVAKNFQYELFKFIFAGQDYETWIREYVKKLKDGEFNEQLIYKKRLSKNPHEYTKNVPPHVKAALLLPQKQGFRLKEVSYVMTRRGPIPLELPHDDIDYQHYIDKQLRPLADDVLTLFDQSFDDFVIGDQLSLF